MTRSRKGPGESRFAQAVAAVLFLAVCAYIGAALAGDLRPGPRTVAVRRSTVSESVELEGLVLRREQAVCTGGRLLATDGSRLAAGAPLAESREGTLYAPAAALFYTGLDGLEALGPEDAEDLSVESLRALMRTDPQTPDEAVGRLVLDYAWYFAALAPADTVLEPGVYTLCFQDLGGRVPAGLLSSSPAEDGQRVLLFRLTEGGRELLSLRLATAQLILSEIEGLELPEEAVSYDTAGQAYVSALTVAGTKEKPVELLYTGQGRCIAAVSREVGSLREGETIVIP